MSVDEALYTPKNQEIDRLYNREPGIAIIPGSNYAREMEKFEQFPSKYGQSPGNPYRYKPFPKMLYRAEHYQGAVRCMAPPPDAGEYTNMREYERHLESARRFTERCQMTVRNEAEMQKAMENGWRESPDEAVAYLRGRDDARGQAAAERNYADRGMSELAKAEKSKIEREAGMHLEEIPEQPKAKRKYTRRAKPAE